MRLTRFRIQDFRAIKDTGWIDCQNITAFAGENESGKTTILLALLKLTYVGKRRLSTTNVYKINEVKRAKINLAEDIPIDRRTDPAFEARKTTFAYAEFELPYEMKLHLQKILPNYENNDRIIISRKYNGEFEIDILQKYAGGGAYFLVYWQ